MRLSLRFHAPPTLVDYCKVLTALDCAYPGISLESTTRGLTLILATNEETPPTDAEVEAGIEP
jgi:hypothetical protein